MVETVVIVGASIAADRYSFKAQRLLKQKGHRVIPVNSRHAAIDGDSTVADLSAVSGAVDTITVYVRPTLSSRLLDEIVRIKPRRVIFNPGAENPRLAAALRQAGIATVDSCTLVMLRTGGF